MPLPNGIFLALITFVITYLIAHFFSFCFCAIGTLFVHPFYHRPNACVSRRMASVATDGKWSRRDQSMQEHRVLLNEEWLDHTQACRPNINEPFANYEDALTRLAHFGTFRSMLPSVGQAKEFINSMEVHAMLLWEKVAVQGERFDLLMAEDEDYAVVAQELGVLQVSIESSLHFSFLPLSFLPFLFAFFLNRMCICLHASLSCL